ncbi:MAG: hypothetical protein M1837_003330 [Sclerophora amabilis]|nr:MAG: hypothetical protein M1837_003330 [Sclerophora amabilis]
MSTHLDRSLSALANPPQAPSSTTASPSPRTRRLRGLSLIRNYTHNHLLSHSSNLLPSSTHPPSTFPESVTASDPQAGASQGLAVFRDIQQVQEAQQLTPKQHQATANSGHSSPHNLNRSPTSGWLPTVGGRSGLSRVASQPQSTSNTLPAAVLSGTAPLSEANPDLTTSMGRRRTGSGPGAHRSIRATYSPAARDFARLDLPAAVGGVPGSSAQCTCPSPHPDRTVGVGDVHVSNAPSHGALMHPEAFEQSGLSESPAANGLSHSQMPSIRFTPHQDPRSTRPSLVFTSVSRTLPSGSSVVRVGRYSEKDTSPNIAPNTPSAAPIGFKSKVVSRRHCEFWCADGQWYIKDVKSSSGTFLNHIRLSTAGVESRPWPVNDGDVVQLGIDFKGGEEMIFRCVKIRVECNRGWQKELNSFNTSTHKRLRNLASQNRKEESDTASTNASECSICLLSVAPCQSLFVAPCSHVWHYKCIRPILIGNMYPQFLCPNCRAVADLEAEVDEPFEDWIDDVDETRDGVGNVSEASIPDSNHPPPTAANPDPVGPEDSANDEDVTNMMEDLFIEHADTTQEATNPDSSESPHTRPEETSPLASNPQHDTHLTAPIDIAPRSAASSNLSSAASRVEEDEDQQQDQQDPAASSSNLSTTLERTVGAASPEGPMTPRNDAGPFILDGSAGQRSGRRQTPSVHELLGCSPLHS